MFKSLVIGALSFAVLGNRCGFGYGHGYDNRDINTINRLNNIENRKIIQLDNAVDRAIGYGNCGLKNELKNELNGIIADGTNQLNSLALNGRGSSHFDGVGLVNGFNGGLGGLRGGRQFC